MKTRLEDTPFAGMVLKSNLFFANDRLLFCCAQISNIQTILGILDLYEKALGQGINKKKTTLFFSKFVSIEVKNAIKKFLGVLDKRV